MGRLFVDIGPSVDGPDPPISIDNVQHTPIPGTKTWVLFQVVDLAD